MEKYPELETSKVNWKLEQPLLDKVMKCDQDGEVTDSNIYAINLSKNMLNNFRDYTYKTVFFTENTSDTMETLKHSIQPNMYSAACVTIFLEFIFHQQVDI